MQTKLLLIILIVISVFSCQDKAQLFEKLDTSKNIKMYFLSSDIMGPNIDKEKSDFQIKNASFYIDNPEAIETIKKNWIFPVNSNIETFSADYYLTYTENGTYRGKISIDLLNKMAISGYGPTRFDNNELEKIQAYIKPLNTRFFEFNNLEEARLFYNSIKDKGWLLPSPDDKEYYKWLEYNGECIIQVNNRSFVKDKDIKKAFKKYMPQRFPNDRYYYNIFRFTPQNSTIRICSDRDLSNQFPNEFHIIIPWKKYHAIIIPLVNFNEQELKETLFTFNTKKYTIIDKIE